MKIAKAIEERGFLRAILYTYYGIPLRMRKYTHSAPFYVGNPFGLCKCERVLERFCVNCSRMGSIRDSRN